MYIHVAYNVWWALLLLILCQAVNDMHGLNLTCPTVLRGTTSPAIRNPRGASVSYWHQRALTMAKRSDASQQLTSSSLQNCIWREHKGGQPRASWLLSCVCVPDSRRNNQSQATQTNKQTKQTNGELWLPVRSNILSQLHPASLILVIMWSTWSSIRTSRSCVTILCVGLAVVRGGGHVGWSRSCELLKKKKTRYPCRLLEMNWWPGS